MTELHSEISNFFMQNFGNVKVINHRQGATARSLPE